METLNRENIAAVKKWRDAVGPDYPLMIDCYMALTLPYAIELARKCEPYNVKWIEETLPPDDYEGYSELKKAVKTTMITTGEHEYTRESAVSINQMRLLIISQPVLTNESFISTSLATTGYGFRTLLEKKCTDILQPDITWCGGMTEARRIVALAAAYDIPIIPHGSSIYSYHLQICFPNCPMAEFLVMSPKADSIGQSQLLRCIIRCRASLPHISYFICNQSHILATCSLMNHCQKTDMLNCPISLVLVLL